MLTRRDFLKHAAIAATVVPLSSGLALEHSAVRPRRAVTSIGMCKRYDYTAVQMTLAKLLDELGDVRRLVRRKHVTVKLNLVNTSLEHVAGVPLSLTVIVHPVVAQALGSLLVGYGARQVTFCDQLPFGPTGAEGFAGYGYDLQRFNGVMDGKARFANTRNRGAYRDYGLVKVPNGELTSAWEVNRAYVDTDVLVSVTKLKSHVAAGITGGMKNLFGIPPSSLYGNDMGVEPNEGAMGYRDDTMHSCTRKPLTSVASFTGKSVAGDHGYNVPRFIVDLSAAFPIDMVVIDGISSIQAAEGWWNGSMVSVTRPGLLIAGRNPVCTDAVAAAVMGFDPDAADRTWPFVNGTNYLALARQRG
ncbi:MAG TPA: DUF362 domain-containing protein, partial [Clostridia bacterium]|nr:DUF362 domain-containing protein [Clostridia bacterium]